MTPAQIARMMARAHAAATLELAMNVNVDEPEVRLALEHDATETQIIDSLALHFLSQAAKTYELNRLRRI